MATRPLTNSEALPALEAIELERAERPARAWSHASWGRAGFALDALMLLAAALAAQLGSNRLGIVRESPLWLLAYGALVLLALRARGLYAWRARLQALDDVRNVVIATVLAAAGVITLRVLLPGDVDDLAA